MITFRLIFQSLRISFKLTYTDGWECAKQLVNAHPDKFKLSKTPAVGSIFSCIGRNHVGIVIGWDGTNITIQDGNLDGKTNSLAKAKKDWQIVTYTLEQFQSICNGVMFATPYINNFFIKAK
ncbi:CHAP domain-containing protein [[Clostridium] spiroforme]|nr:CHAP domain-containing protein [Thomasclavelia spiroformis]